MSCLTLGELVFREGRRRLGPGSLGKLAEYVREAKAAVKKVTLSKNFLFGSKLKYGHHGDTIHDIDANQTGWSSLCESFKGSSIEELILVCRRSPG